ncbi:recQ-mediated genome instability protein 1 [Tripterygium wilfordii]|uniref:RecQ-mediated genome instability protein 1 n=1 Tax=Tripterygium wilfordii TaxID=458696 RepID=A0A7J7CA42_TRIWF|nr:recQ-mediated genome instability protein 1 [Tripterygium wilfordii]KAF5730970.1 recQ-mediated genome instability protein 1 [Tripterygium wilfordii]
MPARRLRLSYSDEDEEEEHNHQQSPGGGAQLQGPTSTHQPLTQSFSNQNPSPIPIPNPTEAITISDGDEEFIDASENISPPSPLLPVALDNFFQPPQMASVVSAMESTGCPVGDFLLTLGLKLKKEWLDSCMEGLGHYIAGFSSLDVAAKAKHCFKEYLFSDMNYSGGGVLPHNVKSLHLVDLPGPFVLQVDEIVNISSPLRGRYEERPAGIKRCLKLSMTDGEQRVFGMEYRAIRNLHVLAPAGLKVAIRNVHIRHGLMMLVPESIEVLGGIVEELDLARQRLVKEVNKPPRGKRTRSGVAPSLANRATLAAWPSDGVNSHGQSNVPDNVVGHNQNSLPHNTTLLRAESQGTTSSVSETGVRHRRLEEFTVPMNGEPTVANSLSNIVSNVEEMHIDALLVDEVNASSNQDSGPSFVPNDSHMVDEFEHPILLSGDQEIPFTYIANLSAKLATMRDNSPSVQGNIKCFLTGVKGFQYKRRTTYELRAYVDDGSLISEILIDHNVVQRGIGYSPVEVTAALSSSDKKIVSDMKETLKQFQIFLANFEGTMLVEMNGTSSLPIALEMSQGCPGSDAWLLFRRVSSFTTAQTPQHQPLDPIEIPP